ncbi:asparaginase [Paracidovorax oryzae]|uniref:asparaginase n=1 Tax=Paracidovorax oryzae TaxID=862720 RepID=UPI00054D1DD0|nr:asparaginase [Paracidovorax oryzae]
MDSLDPATRPICHFISTGGTIAMKSDPASGAPVPALSGDDLLAGVEGLDCIAELRVQNLFNLPSDYMGPDHWIALHHAVEAAMADDEVAGVVVSHGTDTLEETAWFLDLTIASSKPVVLTGAQRNASEQDYDGLRNLRNAVRVCMAPDAGGRGVLVALNNQINAAREVTKSHTSDVEAFKSGDFGLLGVIDGDRIVFSRAPQRRRTLPLSSNTSLSPVAIVCMYAGADGTLIDSAVQSGHRGIVVQALGWGNVNVALYEAIRRAMAAGVAVVISTRVPNGRVRPVYGFVGGGKTLKDLGAVFADNLSPQKARILLMLALQTSQTGPSLQRIFDC